MSLKILTPLVAFAAMSACGSVDRPFDPADTALANPTPELGCSQLELSLGIRGDECGQITLGEAAILMRQQARDLDTDTDFSPSS